MFEIKKPKEYGVLYVKINFPDDDTKYRWLNYCHLIGVLPKDLKKEIFNLADKINEKWGDNIIIPLDKRPMPGCTTEPEVIDEVAKEVFDGFEDIYKRLTGYENVIRLVYGVGEMDKDQINRAGSTHTIGNFPLMVKVGRTLTKRGAPSGLFKV